MDPKDLRIGNYVKFDGGVATIASICGEKDEYLEVKIPGDKIIEIKLTDIKPLPLTGELLVSCCEFEEDGKHVIGVDHHRYYLQIKDNYIVLLNKNDEEMIHFWDVRYLHALQNLYYALKGKEMKVVFNNHN